MTQTTFLSVVGQPIAKVVVADGQSVMHAAVQADVDGIEAECGGCVSCATCHVYVREVDGDLPGPNETELAMLGFVAAERRADSRLSCQLVGGPGLKALVLELPERQF